MPDADKTLKILLQVQADVAELAKLNGGLDETKRKLDAAGSAGGDFGSILTGAIGGLAVGVVGSLVSALAEIPALVARAAEENKKMTEEIGRQGDAIIDNTQKWADMARAADNFKDVVKLGEQIAPQLASAAAQSAAFRSQELSLWKGFIDQIAVLWSGIANINADALAAAKATSGNQFSFLLDSANRTLDDANKAAADAVALKAGPVDQAIAVVTGRIADLKHQLADLDPQRHPAPGANDDQKQNAAEALGFYTQANSKLKEQEALLTSLQKKQEAQTESTHKTADTIELLTAKRKGDAEAIANAAGQKAYEQEVEAKRKLGILDQDAVAAAEEIRKLTHDSVLASEQKKSSAAATRGAAEAERAAHRDIVAFLSEENAALVAIRQQQELINQDPFLFADQKAAAELQSLPIQIQKINDKIRAGRQSIANTALDPATYSRAVKGINSLEFQAATLGQKLKAATQPLRTDLTAWVNQFGSTIHQVGTLITSTLGTAVSGLTSAISGLIFHTTSWGQAFAQVAQSIIQNIIQIVLQWAISRAVMALLNLAFGKAEASAINQEAASSAAAWAPAATAASIASYGAAAGFGLIAYLAAIGTGTAATVAAASGGGGGFAAGGETPGRATLAYVGERGPEYVIDNATYQRAGGRAFFDNLRLDINRPGYERGGSVGGSRRASPSRSSGGDIHVFNFTDMKTLERAYMRSPAAKKMIVDTVNGAGGHLRT